MSQLLFGPPPSSAAAGRAFDASAGAAVDAPAGGAAPESTLAVRVKFSAGVSPSIKSPNFRLHVWSDAPTRRAAYVEVSLQNDVDGKAWHTFSIDSLDVAKVLFFEIHHDQWCDAEAAAASGPAVMTVVRAMVPAAIVRRSFMKVPLVRA
jgi:hypothetical protein